LQALHFILETAQEGKLIQRRRRNQMKVVVQNGASHGLTRKQAESLVALLPPSLGEAVKSLTLYQAEGPALEFRHYPKEQSLGMFWPSSPHAQPLVAEAVRELLVALAIVAERGSLPPRVSTSLRAWAEQEVAELATRCGEALAHNDA
jgi:hypothetical protein